MIQKATLRVNVGSRDRVIHGYLVPKAAGRGSECFIGFHDSGTLTIIRGDASSWTRTFGSARGELSESQVGAIESCLCYDEINYVVTERTLKEKGVAEAALKREHGQASTAFTFSEAVVTT